MTVATHNHFIERLVRKVSKRENAGHEVLNARYRPCDYRDWLCVVYHLKYLLLLLLLLVVFVVVVVFLFLFPVLYLDFLFYHCEHELILYLLFRPNNNHDPANLIMHHHNIYYRRDLLSP